MGNIEEAKVVELKKQRTSKVRPTGLNTIELMKAASKRFGMGA